MRRLTAIILALSLLVSASLISVLEAKVGKKEADNATAVLDKVISSRTR